MMLIDGYGKSLQIDLDAAPTSELSLVAVFEEFQGLNLVRRFSKESTTNGTTAVTVLDYSDRTVSRQLKKLLVHNPNTGTAEADNPNVILRYASSNTPTDTNTALTLDLFNMTLPALHTLVWTEETVTVWNERGQSLGSVANSKPMVLSGSTNGRPIKVVATSSTGTTIHTATTGGVDLVTLYAGNTDTADRKLTLEWGGTTSPDDLIEVTIPAENGLYLVAPELPLRGGLVITAFGAAANVLNIHGKAERWPSV